MRKPNKLWMDNRKNDNGVSIFILLYETRFWYVCTMLVNANFLFVHSIRMYENEKYFSGEAQKKEIALFTFFIYFVAFCLFFISYVASHRHIVKSNWIGNFAIAKYDVFLSIPHTVQISLCSWTSLWIKWVIEEIKQKNSKAIS